MRRPLIALVLVAGAVATVTLASAGVADDAGVGHGLGIRLVDVPVAAADNPRARVYIIDHVRPGETIERRVQVVNDTRHPAKTALYAAAADIGGGGFIGAQGRAENELSSWTSVKPRSPFLEPGDRRLATVRIRVPEDASEGERYAAVWAEVTTPPRRPGGILHVSRVGVRIYLSVGPGGEPASDFAIRSFTAARADDGSPVVQVLVRNTGGRALDLEGRLRLSEGPGGLSAGPYRLSPGTTLGIGQAEQVSVVLDKRLPDGPWLAEATVRSGLLKHTASAKLTFPSAPGASSTVEAKHGAGLPWVAILALVMAVLLLAWLAWLVWRRRRATGRVSDTQPETLTHEDRLVRR